MDLSPSVRPRLAASTPRDDTVQLSRLPDELLHRTLALSDARSLVQLARCSKRERRRVLDAAAEFVRARKPAKKRVRSTLQGLCYLQQELR